jgi:hypothetical protein
MKRRKTLNKYTVGESGQITNNQPKLSAKTQKILSVMSMLSAMGGYMEELNDGDVEVIEEEDDNNGRNEGTEGTDSVCD